jgi:2-hydroxy-6-oxonona-2,4-dienedioate hydrolase
MELFVPHLEKGRAPVRRRMRFAILTSFVIVAFAGIGIAAKLYYLDRQKAEDRIINHSSVMQTSSGTLEYAITGQGPPLMMIHGTGGGFDQGLRFSSKLISYGHRVVAPSRFGYLRSSFPSNPSSENQADALVELLNYLSIDKIPVAGGSAGALSATQFALRHPDRCSALILLVPAANVRGADPVVMSPFQKAIVGHLLTSDFWFWVALRIAPKQLIGTLLATDPKLLDTVPVSERARAYAILEELMPISKRSRGALNDGNLAGNPARIDFSQLQVPTLIISAEDDRFGTAQTARDIAAQLPTSRLVIYKSGGHIWLGHDKDVADEISKFLKQI